MGKGKGVCGECGEEKSIIGNTGLCQDCLTIDHSDHSNDFPLVEYGERDDMDLADCD
jgi:hypothetical protein